MPDASKPAESRGPVPSASEPASRALNFIEQMVEADNAAKKWGVWPDRPATPRVQTRFPPEPNGYLHIGHAKSILLNYGLAKKYGGKFNLRFDDTNPAKEEQEYVDAIMEDVRWLGADWTAGSAHGGGLYWGSAYFEQMYEWAEELIGKGLAYVCELNAEDVSKRRGTPSVAFFDPDAVISRQGLGAAVAGLDAMVAEVRRLATQRDDWLAAHRRCIDFMDAHYGDDRVLQPYLEALHGRRDDRPGR